MIFSPHPVRSISQGVLKGEKTKIYQIIDLKIDKVTMKI